MGKQLTQKELDDIISKYIQETNDELDRSSVLDSLTQYFNFFIDETQKLVPKAFEIKRSYPPDRSLPSFNFGFQALFDYQRKLQNLTEAVNSHSIQMITHLVLILSTTPNTTCDFETFKSDIQKNSHNNPEITSLRKDIKRLEHYLTSFASIPRIEPIKPDEIGKYLQEAAQQVDSSTEFSADGTFEEIFYRFVIHNNKMGTFDLMALSMVPEDKNSPKPLLNIHKFNSFLENQSMALGPQNEEELFVLKCAIMRLVFDRLYTYHPRMLNHAESTVFFKQCKLISQLKPPDIGIPERLLKEEHLTMTLREMYESSEELQHAIEELSLIQFYPNPIDIVDRIFKCMKKIELFVSSNSNNSGSMSFDDFFGLFLAVMVIDPPPNTVSISTFLSSLDGLQLSSPFQFAMVLFTTAVGYVTDNSVEEIMRLAKLD